MGSRREFKVGHQDILQTIEMTRECHHSRRLRTWGKHPAQHHFQNAVEQPPQWAKFNMTDYIEEDEDNRDEYSTHDQPAQPSFQDRYGYDERDGPPEEQEEERGYVNGPDEPLDERN
jgi:hypothetical protein